MNEEWDKKARIKPSENAAKIVSSDAQISGIDQSDKAIHASYGSEWEDVVKFESEDGTDKRYKLTVSVFVRKVPLMNNGTVYYKNRVFFIPDESTETVFFYNTYLPAHIESNEGLVAPSPQEIVFMSLSLGRPFIGMVNRADKMINRPYILLMNDEMAERFFPFNGKKTVIESLTLKESEEQYNNC